jgi:hypothetical protein
MKSVPHNSAAVDAPSRKWRAIFLILVGLLIAISAALFFWWQHYQTTPAYTLALLVDAAQQNDGEAFDQVVDMDRVVDNFMSQMGQTTGGISEDFATTIRTRLQSVAPGVMATIKQTVREETRKQINEVTSPFSTRPFLLTAVAIPFKANISESADMTNATINSREYQVELVLERGDDGRWRVVSLRDDALAARIANNILRDLPGTELQLDGEIQKQVKDLPDTLRKLPVLSDK